MMTKVVLHHRCRKKLELSKCYSQINFKGKQQTTNIQLSARMNLTIDNFIED